MLNKNILILEDDLQTLSKIFSKLAELEDKLKIEFSHIVLSESTQVDEIINKNTNLSFDLVLLDRDTKDGASFHNLNIERFGVDRVIAISSVPDYNEQLRKRGVTNIVHKDYRELDDFVERLGVAIERLLDTGR